MEKERVIHIDPGERVVICFNLADGSVAMQYAIVESRPPHYKPAGSRRTMRPAPFATGAVAMKQPQGTGTFTAVGLHGKG